jgi:diguanylate cyclase (GGDEF)-like protein
MNPEVLEKVLACKTLPTLPAVAAKVIELTSDKSVSMKALAETITNDQGLSAKILRTVNSSFYGLRQRCSSINQAIVMLGLSAVKSLALGFSLVQAVSEAEGDEFDHVSYWRRALYTGIAGRCIAREAKAGFEEECFLGGLLQDVGMIALHQALGTRYESVLAKASGDHRALIRHELSDLEVQHPDVGALLAARWRLPEELVLPVKYHERPTAAPANHVRIVRAVGLGNIAADVLTTPEPTEALRRFYERAQQWFSLTETQADEILKAIGAAAREVAGLLQVDAGPAADVKAILSQARERLVNLNVTTEETGAADQPAENTVPEDPSTTDELTGLPTRLRFEQTMIAAFEQARVGAGPLSIALFEIDGLAEINASYGEEAGDTVVIHVARRIREAFKGTGALVCCYESGRFGVAMPRTDRNAALRAADKARKFVESEPVDLIAGRNAPPKLAVTASVGIAAAQPDTIRRFDSPAALMKMTEQAVHAATKAGKNTMKVYAPTAAAAA